MTVTRALERCPGSTSWQVTFTYTLYYYIMRFPPYDPHSLFFLVLYWLFVSCFCAKTFVRRLLCLTSLLIHTLELKGERSERVHFLQGPVDKSYSVTLRFEEARDPESINCSRSLSTFDQISLWNAYHLVTMYPSVRQTTGSRPPYHLATEN